MRYINLIDQGGRVVIPSPIRKTFGISPGDFVRLYMSDESLVIEKGLPRCVFCNSTSKLISHMGRLICYSCLDTIKNNLNPEEFKVQPNIWKCTSCEGWMRMDVVSDTTKCPLCGNMVVPQYKKLRSLGQDPFYEAM